MSSKARHLAVVGLCFMAACNDRQTAAESEMQVARAETTSPYQVLRTETVPAVFTGWDRGDYVWARLSVAGREPIGVWSGPWPIDLFLDSHVGKPLIVTLQTIRADVPEAGGQMELQRISAARSGEITAEAWWQSLSAKERQDAQIRLAGALEPRPPAEQR